MTEVESNFIEVDHRRVHYLIAGPAEGRPVVLLHGFSNSWESNFTLRELAKAGYHAYAITLPGYFHGGWEFHRSEQIIGSSKTWLSKLLDALNVSKPVVVSEGRSGRFSMPLLTEESDRLGGFVAVNTESIMAYQHRFQRITCPVLAVWGDDDRVKQAELFVTSVAKGRIVVIPGSPNPIYNDQDRWHRELLGFLGEVAGSDSGQ